MSVLDETGSDIAAGEKIALLYDYSKHLLSLALLGIGGILSLSQSEVGRSIPGQVLALTTGCLALAGFAALSCSASILRARQRDLPLGRIAWIYSQLAMMFLGMGVGGFIVVFVKAILAGAPR